MNRFVHRNLLVWLVLALTACSPPVVGTPVEATPPGPVALPTEAAHLPVTAAPTLIVTSALLQVVTASPPGLTAYPEPQEELDPYVEIDVERSELRLGETVTITGRPLQLAASRYFIFLRDEGVQDTPAVAQISAENVLQLDQGRSQVLELVSAQADANQVTIVLRAIAPGLTTLSIQADGEIRTLSGLAGSGMASGEALLVVLP